MKTWKKIKMIVAIIVAILSLVGFIGIFCSYTSEMFIIRQIPGIRLRFEKDIIACKQLDSLIEVKNLQIDSLTRLQNKTDADKLLKSNYEFIKIDYEHQKNYIERDMNFGVLLISLMLFLIYLGLCIFVIAYIISSIQKQKKTWYVGRDFPPFFLFCTRVQ